MVQSLILSTLLDSPADARLPTDGRHMFVLPLLLAERIC